MNSVLRAIHTAPPWAVPAAAVAVAALVLWLIVRKYKLAATLRGIAIPLVLLFEAQGLFLLLIQRLHAPRDLAYILAGVAAALVLALGAHADKHYKKHGKLGPNGRRMWWVAVLMGLAVALNAGSLSGFLLRLALPSLSVVAFQAPYLPDEPRGAKRDEKRGTWRWTPRRLAVQLGAIDPTDADLTEVHRERHTRRLVSHGLGCLDGPGWLRAWHRKRLARCLRLADDDMVAEARSRATRVRDGLALDASAGLPPGSSAWPRPAPVLRTGDASAPPGRVTTGRRPARTSASAGRDASLAPVRDASALPAPTRLRPLSDADSVGRNKVREILDAEPDAARRDVAARAGVSESTVDRVKRDMKRAARVGA